MAEPDNRLYIVVRADLPPGLQIAQAVHAALDHCESLDMAGWSNYLVVCSVPDEAALAALLQRAGGRDPNGRLFYFPATEVREPDLGGELTAAAFGPSKAARQLCANLPLALRSAIPV